jgi:AcrR family transcriptional regulator
MKAQQADSPRARLLRATVDYVAAHGVADLTLRRLAAALGTSHRMLIHHFGSKEELLVEVVRTVEQQQREALAEVGAPGVPLEEVGRQLWRRLLDPALDRQERLFFELYGQALQGRPWAATLLEGIVDDWVAVISAWLEAEGAPPDVAAVDARLSVAVTRGLLLDALATGDRAAVEAAMERFLQLLASRPMRPT